MFYPVFLALNALEMLFESWISTRNSKKLLQRGAVEIAPGTLPVMVFLYVLMYVCSFVEYRIFHTKLSWEWITVFGALFLLAKALKFWSVRSLGGFWTMRVLIVPKSNVVTKGPYRWIRHPNYVAVLLEIAATTLLGKSYATFLLVILSFSVTLVFRIRSEESALRELTDYSDQMVVRRRFLP